MPRLPRPALVLVDTSTRPTTKHRPTTTNNPINEENTDDHIPLARTVRKLKQAISRRLPQRRDDSGLTTLEWLLIVAAVAGLAALAVVLVQNVVSDTAEQIGSNSARMTSAELTAVDITSDARAFVSGKRA